jgi:hypothetical protein
MDENASCAVLIGTMTAEAVTEFESPACVFGGELSSSSDIVGMAVGVAAEPQAESKNAIIIATSNFLFFILTPPSAFH